jgi:hypothetical protein
MCGEMKGAGHITWGEGEGWTVNLKYKRNFLPQNEEIVLEDPISLESCVSRVLYVRIKNTILPVVLCGGRSQ